MFMDGWMDTWIMFLSFNTKKNLQPHQGEIKNVKTAFYSSQKKSLTYFNQWFQALMAKLKATNSWTKINTKKPKKVPVPKVEWQNSAGWGEICTAAGGSAFPVELWPVYKYINMFKEENEINSSL